MRAALFLTTTPERARELLALARERHPDASLCAFVRDDDRPELGDALRGAEIRRDKAEGGRLAFLKSLRAERFDLLLVALHGGDRPYPLKLVAPFCGARRTLGIDERGRAVSLSLLWPIPMLGHLLRRIATSKPDPVRAARFAAAGYRRTVGLLLGSLWNALSFACWQIVRRK